MCRVNQQEMAHTPGTPPALSPVHLCPHAPARARSQRPTGSNILLHKQLSKQRPMCNELSFQGGNTCFHFGKLGNDPVCCNSWSWSRKRGWRLLFPSVISKQCIEETYNICRCKTARYSNVAFYSTDW